MKDAGLQGSIFTLIGNRMKGRRACWSINGANHLALILCACHTTGLDTMFAPLSATKERKQPEVTWSSVATPKKMAKGKSITAQGHYGEALG